MKCRKCAGTGSICIRIAGENAEGTCPTCRGSGYLDENHSDAPPQQEERINLVAMAAQLVGVNR